MFGKNRLIDNLTTMKTTKLSPLFLGFAAISLGLTAGCLKSNSSQSEGQTLTIPQSDLLLPEALNLRDNLLEMRGIEPDFTAESWRKAGLNALGDWRPGGGYYLLGELPNQQERVTTLLILEDRPEESNAWLINYRGDSLSDHLLVFHRNDLQERTVGSDYRDGQLSVRLNKNGTIYGETFLVHSSGAFEPVAGQ